MAVASPRSNVCECRRRSKNLALKACYEWPSTAITCYGRNVLRPQWECYLTKQTRGVGAKVTGKLWEWREPQSACMYSSPCHRCPSLISDAARRTTTHAADRHARRWVIPVWRQFIYDRRLLKLSAAVLDHWSCLMQPRCVVHTHTHTHTHWYWSDRIVRFVVV